MTGLCASAGLVIAGGCSSGADGAASSEPSAPASPPSSDTAASASAGSIASPPADATNPVSVGGAAPVSPPAAQAPADAEPAVDACEAVAGDDACGACVCSECRSELDDCAGVGGCSLILACVRESGCAGNDCYCGDASLTGCVSGQANGPCREVVLAAPGGKAPTLLDPSAGPASDAALRVADCAAADEICRDTCGLSD